MEESQTNQQPAKVEGEADVLDLPVGLVSGSLASVSAETLENPVPPLQWNLAAEMEETIEHLMKTLLNEVETNVEQRLNHLVSSSNDEDKAISELLEVQLEEEVSASVQPLAENEMTMTMKVPDEAETEASKELMSTHLEHTEDSEATDKHMDINLDDIKETPLEKHLENEMTMTMVTDAAEAEATMETMDITNDENEKKPLEKHLDKMDIKKDDPPEEDAKSTKRYNRRGTRGKGRGISYKSDNNPQDSATNEIRVSAHRTGAEGLRGKCREVEEERKNPPETPRPKAHPHQQQRMMERHEEKRERPQWKKEQGQRTQGLSERRSSGQRDVRKNWGDERRQVFHPRRVQEERRPDRNDSGVSAPKGGAEELRGQCRNVQEERKTPVENPRPKTHPHQQRKTEEHGEPREHPHWKRGQRTQHTFIPRSSQKDNRRNRNEERRQVFRPSQDQEQTDKRSTAVTDSSTALRTGETERRAREDPRVESTPPRTERNAGRERSGGEPRVRRPPWWKHDNR
ncbi:hypothetical protein SRHO_G00099870 [Serrasalmus rhombeus]